MPSMQESNESPLSPAERQRRYRTARRLVSIDVGRLTVETLGTLRARTGMTTDGLIARSLAMLEAELDDKSQPAARKAPSAEQSKSSSRIRTTISPTSKAGSREARTRSPSPGDVIAETAHRGGQAASSRPKRGTGEPHRGLATERPNVPRPARSGPHVLPASQGVLDGGRPTCCSQPGSTTPRSKRHQRAESGMDDLFADAAPDPDQG